MKLLLDPPKKKKKKKEKKKKKKRERYEKKRVNFDNNNLSKLLNLTHLCIEKSPIPFI